MFHVVLVQPEIPPNTGNIIRLCANTGCTLHLVKPIGFDISLKAVRRAGLDYDALADVRTHIDIDACFAELNGARPFIIETTGAHAYSDVSFKAGDAFIFGSEHRGLSAAVLERVPRDQHLSIPMRPANRSLNLSNSVALVVYEAWRQHAFAGAGPPVIRSPP
jgi:tRNA (cytidine/uridine-2'-O-)-methyltransferase